MFECNVEFPWCVNSERSRRVYDIGYKYSVAFLYYSDVCILKRKSIAMHVDFYLELVHVAGGLLLLSVLVCLRSKQRLEVFFVMIVV